MPKEPGAGEGMGENPQSPRRTRAETQGTQPRSRARRSCRRRRSTWNRPERKWPHCTASTISSRPCSSPAAETKGQLSASSGRRSRRAGLCRRAFLPLAELPQAEQVLRTGRHDAAFALDPLDHDGRCPGADRRAHRCQVIERDVRETLRSNKRRKWSPVSAQTGPRAAKTPLRRLK